MFAPQNQQPNVIDSMNGSMEEWYNAVDEAVKKSEVIPGNYEYTVATSYGNVGSIPEGSSTNFDIACDRFKVISLDNSFITIEQDVQIEFPKHDDATVKTYYIGYKYAADAIDQYRIYSNTDNIYTQNFANYEWFMTYNSISDEAKENSDLFATVDKIRQKNPFVPGVYVELGNTEAKTVTVHLKVRIPVSSFLMLQNLRFFPNWSGKLTIEVYPSYKNLVICPVVPDVVLLRNKFQTVIEKGIDDIELGFKNINQSMKNHIVGKDIGKETESWTIASQTFKCNGAGCQADKCKIRLATYLLKMDVFNALAAKYIQIPLIFPIQTLQIKDFTNPLLADASTFTTANTVALKHCDAMFTVFKRDVHARTCFENPFITFQFNVDGRMYPREQISTYEDERFINQTLDALNLNNSLLTSLGKDLRNSLQPYYRAQKVAEDGTLTTEIVYNDGDNSNFMIGLPFCDSEDFMGGISTAGTVQIELAGNRPATGFTNKQYSCTAICFEDALMKIRAMKPDGRSQIEITNASIEQLLAGQAS